ncbi:hypothetical protein [Pantoea agglomerans]|uniref:Uncharacterized protein n=1 Tax=Enterobacter agglomerans TaxID=549 RepID=A0ACC5PM25_ENTAG|nr:hypothetical protein [Pantoea agglomerans]MBD8126062.1 hypothetical protein [Pantoea agglomerans]MBD8153350.1 hypothetical protein [Pantoea agglomerans]MBD8245133.1 hypothetical protein [Pantoea agglomerans]NEG82083.1 hypothetical protein [Pantoea agglomerans]
MKPLLIRNTLSALLLCAATGSYAASVESEVSATDNVVIGAASEKVTLRVTGYKNLKGNETVFGSFYISTTSSLGQLAYTLAPENEPSSYYNGSDYYIKGKIKNEAGESSEIFISGHNNAKEINGEWWNIAQSANYSGQVSQFSGALKPGTYNIGLRAAIYQQ